MEYDLIFKFAVIFLGASCLGTLLVFLRQPIILGYIGIGILVGPHGANLINSSIILDEIAGLGIIFLLFLLGLNLPLSKLLKLFRKSALLTLATSIIFAGSAMGICMICKFNFTDSAVIGLALMFSSTVIGLKLLPTTALHHQRIGELMTSVLLLQDIMAILLLVVIFGGHASAQLGGFQPIITLIGISAFAFFGVKRIIFPLFMRFDTIQEFIFLISVGWCFLISALAYAGGTSHEIGAFIAGTSLATSPMSLIIAERLKPLREFFLILFFFAVGAKFNCQMPLGVFFTGLLVFIVLTVIKPIVFRAGFKALGETDKAGKELGMRLGQVSEFALLLAHSALIAKVISQDAGAVINLVVILSFIVSTFFIVRGYPTPIGSSKLCKD